MSTRVGLISDVHATPAPLAEALAHFAQERVTTILCAGDIAGYGRALDATVALLENVACQAILGNHEQRYLQQHINGPATLAGAYFKKLPASRTLTLAGRRLYMVHASPPDSCLDGIRLLDENGAIMAGERTRWMKRLAGFAYNILVVGHTHQMFAEWFGDTLVINPGSTVFNHSCAILTLPEMTVRWHPLSGKAPVRAWNWGTDQITKRA